MAGRVRRTNAEIDNAVMTELEKLVIRNGFEKVLVTELMANAKLEPPVFYRRYGSIDSLYDKLAKRYDFWINDTIKMSELSDLMNLNLVEYYDVLFKSARINIRGVIALLISGVYYLILHKERAPFCKIDFNTPEGKAAFSEAVDILVGMLFDRIDGHNQKRESYERMIKDGISKKKACQYLGVGLNEFDS